MLADRLAAATVAQLAERESGIRRHDRTARPRHDITNNLLTGSPPALESAINTVVSADALIVVTPIFSTSYSGLFKSFIDVLDPDALTGMPVLIGANAGTARHSLAIDYAIRPLFAYLHADAVSTGVFAASSDWGGAADQVAPLSARVEKGARELAEAVARRAGGGDPFDPENYLDSFQRLIGGGRVGRRTPAGRARGRIVARSRSARGEPARADEIGEDREGGSRELRGGPLGFGVPLHRDDRQLGVLDRLDDAVGGDRRGGEARAELSNGLVVPRCDGDLVGIHLAAQPRRRDFDGMPRPLQFAAAVVPVVCLTSSSRTGRSSTSVPPKATLSTCSPRHTPRMGSPAATAAAVTAKSRSSCASLTS
jgi:FMN reductase